MGTGCLIRRLTIGPHQLSSWEGTGAGAGTDHTCVLGPHGCPRAGLPSWGTREAWGRFQERGASEWAGDPSPLPTPALCSISARPFLSYVLHNKPMTW